MSDMRKTRIDEEEEKETNDELAQSIVVPQSSTINSNQVESLSSKPRPKLLTAVSLLQPPSMTSPTTPSLLTPTPSAAGSSAFLLSHSPTQVTLNTISWPQVQTKIDDISE